jgi:hypothetical protein
MASGVRAVIQRCKPAVSARVQLLLAGLLWTIVGTSLLSVGFWWGSGPGGAHGIGFLASALLVGMLKAHFVLGRAAQRIISRIRARGDGCCVGGFISWRSWLFVLGMMLLGTFLRHGPVPRVLVGFIYAAVGTALLTASRHLWRAWSGPRVGA